MRYGRYLTLKELKQKTKKQKKQPTNKKLQFFPMGVCLLLSPLHGLRSGQFPGQSVTNSQHVGATFRQRALLIQHQPVAHKHTHTHTIKQHMKENRKILWALIVRPREMSNYCFCFPVSFRNFPITIYKKIFCTTFVYCSVTGRSPSGAVLTVVLSIFN